MLRSLEMEEEATRRATTSKCVALGVALVDGPASVAALAAAAAQSVGIPPGAIP